MANPLKIRWSLLPEVQLAIEPGVEIEFEVTTGNLSGTSWNSPGTNTTTSGQDQVLSLVLTARLRLCTTYGQGQGRGRSLARLPMKQRIVP